MRIRLLKIAGLTIGGLLIGGVALVHTPPAKRFALAKLQNILAAQGIRLDASGLDYNLLSMRLELRDVVVQPVASLPPLARLKDVRANLSLWDLLRGYIVVTEASATQPQIYLVIDANGLSNLPESKDKNPDPNASAEWLVSKLVASAGSFEFEDRRQGTKIVLPQWDLHVEGTRVTKRHRAELTLSRRGSVAYGGKSYPVEVLHVVADAGMKDVRVDQLQLRTPGAELAGSVSVADFEKMPLGGKFTLVAEPGRFVPEVAGKVRIDGSLSGNAAKPIVEGQLQGTDVAYDRYRGIGIHTAFRFDGDRLTARDLAVSSPFATVAGEADVALSAGQSRLKAQLSKVNLAPFVPGVRGSASGDVEAQWEALRFVTATGQANFRVNVPNAEARGTVAVAAGGRLRGNVRAHSSDIATLPLAKVPVHGPATVEARLSGTIEKPAAEFTVDSPGLNADPVQGIRVAAEGSANLDQVTLRRGEVAWNNQTIRAAGTVGLKGAAPTLNLDATVQNVEIADVLTALDKKDVPVSGTVNLTAAVRGTTKDLAGQATLDASGLIASGETLGRLTATATFAQNQVTIPDLHLVKAPGEELRARGTYDLKTESFTLSADSDPLRFTRGTVALRAEGSGTPDFPRLKANVDGETPEVGPVHAVAELEGTQWKLTGNTEKQKVELAASGSTEAPYALTFDVQAKGTDLASLPVAVPETLRGTITARAQGALEPERWRDGQATVHIDALNLEVDGQPIRSEGPIEAKLANQTLTLAASTVTAPGTRLTIGGQLPGTVSIDGQADLATLHKTFRPQNGLEAADGVLSLQGEIRGTWAAADRFAIDPQLTMRLTDGFYFNQDIAPVSDVQFLAKLGEGTLRVDTLSAAWSNAAITGTAELPLGLLPALPVDLPRKNGNVQAAVSVKGLDFSAIQGMPEAVGGRTSITLTAEGARPELEAIRAELRFDELEATSGRVKLAQDGVSRVVLENGTARVEQFTINGPETKIALTGTAQLTGAQALDLHANSTVDLGLLSLFTDSVRARGKSELAFDVTGTVPKPDARGYLQLADADLSLESPRVLAEKLNLRLDLAGDRVNIANLRGTLNGGSLRGSGGIAYRDGGLRDADVNIVSRNVYLDYPANLKTVSNLNITLKSAGVRTVLGGEVTIVEGSYTDPINLDQGLLNVLNSSATPESVEERSPILEKLDYNLAIKTQNPLVVDNNLAEAELEMDARLTGTFYRPGMTGQVIIAEGGTLNLNERKYIVDRGVLTFADENRIEPSFDVVANTQAAGYDISLSIQGSGKERTTTLTSDPALPEPDIAAVLLTGRTLEEMQGNSGDVAKEQVLSYLTGRVGGSIGRGIEQATGISQVRIEPNLIANESDPSARLTVGQNLTRQLSLIYSMNLVDSGDQIIVGQYDFTRRFRTRALKQSDNSYRFDFSRKQEFGGQAPPPASKAEREKRKVGDVAFAGNNLFTEEQLRKWLSARQGKTYDFFKVRRGVDRIADKYAAEGHLEARVRVNRSRENGEVDLEVDVQEGPKVDFVYEGFRPTKGLQKKIRQKWSAGVFDLQRAEDAASILKEDLVSRGYLSAKIESQIDTAAADRKRVVFDIQTGPKFDNTKLIFAGAKGIEESDLRQALKERKLESAGVTRPQQAIDALRTVYQQRGYLDARIGKPELILDEAAHTGRIVFPVDEGPLYKVADIRFSGNTVYRPEDLLHATTLEEGYDYLPELREETIANLRELYSRKGYNDAEVEYVLARRPEQGKVDVDFKVTEGPQTVVEKIEISGNDETSKNLIRSQLEIKPGEPLDPNLLSLSRRHLYSTGAYSLIDIQRSYMDVAGNLRPAALDVRVREIRPFMVNYGGYFDTDRGPGGIVDFANRNSLGSARTIGLRMRYDSDLQEGRLYFTQPLLRRFPLRTTASSYVRRELRDGFNTDRIGFSVLQESRFLKSWILNYGYRMERTRTYDTGPDPLFDATLRVAPFTTSLSRDTRDDILDATRGQFFSNSVEYAPTWSGSELNFIKYFGQYFRYFAFDKPKEIPMQKGMRKHRLVYATGVRVGLGHGLNGQDLIAGRSSGTSVALGERFFAGGGTTIRGFAQDGVGPRLYDGGPAAGGDGVFILNNEMRFPLMSIFDGVGFVDVGNVYERLGQFRPWDVRKTAGLGIRIRTPYFLIRFDYGIKLDRKPGEPLGQPFFSIGQAF